MGKADLKMILVKELNDLAGEITDLDRIIALAKSDRLKERLMLLRQDIRADIEMALRAIGNEIEAQEKRR